MTNDNSARIRKALPGYDIGGQIGAGGCGEVFGGIHRELGRRVAIKQIPPQFAGDPEIRSRFKTEAKLVAAIDHPHVVSVYDYIQEPDLCLLVMEYLPGGTVESRFKTDGFDPSATIAVALACAAGLQDAHQRGVLHRDIKPANLMFSANGTVKLTDFGIAKIMAGDGQLVTKTGEIIGTPAYIAPEQARGLELSPATDVYALATMTYQLLSGKLPFPPGPDAMAILFMHAFEQPTPLSEVAPQVPTAIADVVMRGLATNPSDRFNSAESFAVALAQLATRSWGADWLTQLGMPIMGADTITAAATGRDHAATSYAPTAIQHTLVDRTRVRPTQPLPRATRKLSDLNRSDVKPARRLVAFPSPRVPAFLALALAGLAVVIAALGPVRPATSGNPAPGVLTVAGADPAVGTVPQVDLAHPIPVTVSAPDATKVALSLNILGLPVATEEAAVRGGVGSVPSPVNPLLLAGQLGADAMITNGNKSTTGYGFRLQTVQSPLPTAATVGLGLLALFSAAYFESSLRTLRRGRGAVTSGAGAVISAVVFVLAGLVAMTLYLGRQPTLQTLAGAVSLAAAAAVAASIAAARAGKVRRYRRSLDRALALTLTRQLEKRNR